MNRLLRIWWAIRTEPRAYSDPAKRDFYWMLRYFEEHRLRDKWERTAKVKFGDHANLAAHLADVNTKNKRLKETVRQMQLDAERHNAEAYATGLIVHCTGCEPGKPFKGEELTEERVRAIEQISSRVRSWFNNHKYRKSRAT